MISKNNKKIIKTHNIYFLELFDNLFDSKELNLCKELIDIVI
jgi:hypothetical protein